MIIVRHINKGGFGTVDEVELTNGTRFAKKTYSPSPTLLASAVESKLLKRFKREARVQSLLDKQFFMPIVDQALDEVPPYYLMPLADKNLDAEIQTLRPMGEVPFQALADILNSLEKLHELGYVHRDLKPQNVLLHEGVWKLSDFGLVLPPSDETTKLTSLYSAWGTQAYCAPEQALQFAMVTSAVDIYAFGCILHDTFVGSPRIPYQRHGGLGAIGTIIEKCTEFKPQDRFRSIAALRSSLLPLFASGGATATSVVAPTGWAKAVGLILSWNNQQFRDFLQYMASTQQKSDLSPVVLEVGEDEIRHLISIDSDVWTRFASEYCDWVQNVGFDFGVCDIVVRRLEVLFELGNAEIKASAALAAAEMAVSHNRWFVMGQVLRLCGPELDDLLAHRIAIEIIASDAKHDFQRCADGISRSIDAYHSKIADVLRD